MHIYKAIWKQSKARRSLVEQRAAVEQVCNDNRWITKLYHTLTAPVLKIYDLVSSIID